VYRCPTSVQGRKSGCSHRKVIPSYNSSASAAKKNPPPRGCQSAIRNQFVWKGSRFQKCVYGHLHIKWPRRWTIRRAVLTLAPNSSPAGAIQNVQECQKGMCNAGCIKGLFARWLQIIERSGMNSRRFDRTKSFLLIREESADFGMFCFGPFGFSSLF
jgi:hypothetical protein